MPKKRKQKNSKREIIAVVLFATAVIFAISIYGLLKGDIARFIKESTFGLVGVLNYATPAGMIVIAILIIANKKKKPLPGKVFAIIIGSISLLAILQLFSLDGSFYDQSYGDFLEASYVFSSQQSMGGGIIGALFLYPLYSLVGLIFAYIIFFLIVIVSVLIITRLSIKEMSMDISKASKQAVNKVKTNVSKAKTNMENKREERRVAAKPSQPLYITDINREEEYEIQDDSNNMFIASDASPTVRRPGTLNNSKTDRNLKPRHKPQEVKERYAEEITEEEVAKPIQRPKKPIRVTNALRDEVPVIEENEVLQIPPASDGDYEKPSIELLYQPPKRARKNAMDMSLKNAALLEETLMSFGVSAKVIDVSRGPAITRFELQPATGVKISRIVQLSDDIALNLAAPRVRIEAPIPGKAAVGIEIPNTEVDSVYIHDLVSSPEYSKAAAKSPLTFALGKDLAGKNIYADINTMPHMLVAGATGAGKSVCINTIITSLLLNASPNDVRLIMVDPKVVELSVYNDIPHLMIPVVTDPKKAASALNWAVAEMTQRYKTFAKKGVKDLKRYNTNIGEEEEKLPYLVIIIDELADLMMVAQNEVEEAICRIAQLGRACGIHLIIATQRPSVDVITGIIKANIPSRIAFAVSSQVDSRTILDMAGAEKLLGKGDMLYYPIGVPKPIRVQGAFIQDSEVEKITDFLKERTQSNYSESVMNNLSTPAGNVSDEDADVLLPRAIEVGLEFGSVSISMIQRRLRVGYARAARLLDEMEVRGLVSPFEGSKPRQMLISREEFEALNSSANGEEEQS